MDFIIDAAGQLVPESPRSYANPKYHNEHGLCCTDENGNFIRDANNNLIPADPRTGAPKVETIKCPTCAGKGRVAKAQDSPR